MNEYLPLITVVTPTYEKFDYIFKTIDSVLKQSYENIEFILSDDASKSFPQNEIINYIDAHKKRNIKNFLVLQNESNLGTVKHLNRIYKKAAGEIIINLAGDDVFYNESVIENIVEFFNSHNSKIVVTSRVVCDEDLRPLFFFPHLKERKIIKKLNTPQKQYSAFVTEKFYDMASGSAVAFRKSVFSEIGYYDENYVLWEDVPFFTRFTLENKIDFAYEIISIFYRMGGVSNKNSRENPLMHNDRIFYNHTDRVRHLGKLGRFKRTYVNYINLRYEISSRWRIAILYLRHPLLMLDKLFYKIKRKYYLNYDMRFINNNFSDYDNK